MEGRKKVGDGRQQAEGERRQAEGEWPGVCGAGMRLPMHRIWSLCNSKRRARSQRLWAAELSLRAGGRKR